MRTFVRMLLIGLLAPATVVLAQQKPPTAAVTSADNPLSANIRMICGVISRNMVGLSPGLVQAMNQDERAIAYRYYVEQSASHPAMIGTHWFQWLDQPATGRNDGENYSIGFVDVSERPYTELVAAAKLTHARLLDVHRGTAAPFDRLPKASEAGTAPPR
jgi:hypothetical protein